MPREIYHSLKNHIQTISSLIELYGSYSEDESFNRGINTAVSKFYVMALVLRFFEIEEKRALNELVEALFQHKKYEYDAIEFSSSVDLNIKYEVNFSMRLLIIINELIDHCIVNLDEENLKININGSQNSNGLNEITLEALSSASSAEDQSFRLKLAEAFILQIEGEFSFEEKSGGFFCTMVLKK